MTTIRENLKEDIFYSIWEEFNKELDHLRNLFDELGIPTILWERCGIIHYSNKAYQELTGFSLSLPTNIFEFGIYNVRIFLSRY